MAEKGGIPSTVVVKYTYDEKELQEFCVIIDFFLLLIYFTIQCSKWLQSRIFLFGRYSMAQHKSAEKRARVSKRRAVRNAAAQSKLKSAVKKVRGTKDKAQAQAELQKTVKLLDKLAAKGVIHKNKAANNKSKLVKLINKMK
jgi:small subunit ribosomal protein S20